MNTPRKIIKECEYEIPKLNEKQYSFLKHMFMTSCYGGKPNIKMASLFLIKEDLLRIYAVDEEYYNKLIED